MNSFWSTLTTTHTACPHTHTLNTGKHLHSATPTCLSHTQSVSYDHSQIPLSSNVMYVCQRVNFLPVVHPIYYTVVGRGIGLIGYVRWSMCSGLCVWEREIEKTSQLHTLAFFTLFSDNKYIWYNPIPVVFVSVILFSSSTYTPLWSTYFLNTVTSVIHEGKVWFSFGEWRISAI